MEVLKYEKTYLCFFFYDYYDLGDLHSFPTRRSSDLALKFGMDTGLYFRREILAPFLAQYLKDGDRKSTRLNSSHGYISYAVFCLKKKKTQFTFLSRLGLAGPYAPIPARLLASFRAAL